MPRSIFKTVSLFCAGCCTLLGFIYLFLWYWLHGNIPKTGIAYFSSIAFVLVGIGLFSLYMPSFFLSSKSIGVIICLLSLVKLTDYFLLPNNFLNQYAFFSTSVNPINVIAIFLIGIFFILWQSKKNNQYYFSYSFFIAITSISLGLIGLLIYIFEIEPLYEEMRLGGILTLMVAGAGIINSLIYFESIFHVAATKWLPYVVGALLFNFFITLSFGVYLNEESLTKFPEPLIIYTFFGGVVISVITALLVYYVLLSKIQLNQVLEAEKQLKIIQDEEQAALEAADVGTWRWDIEKNKVQWDALSYQLFGFNPQIIDVSFEDLVNFMYPEDRPLFQSTLEKCLKTHEPYDVSFRFYLPNRTVHHLRLKGKVYSNHSGSPSLLTGIVVDVTSSKYAEELLHMSESLTKIFGRSISLKDAATQILHLFHKHFNWEILAIWKKNPTTDQFDCLSLETCGERLFQNFIEASKNIRMKKRDPILEMLIENPEPIAIENMGKKAFFRSKAALKDEVQGALIFPILEKDCLVGIIELFKSEPFKDEIDPHMREFLNAVSVNINEYIEKIKSESAVRELAKIVTTSREPIYSCSVDGIILSWNHAAEKTFGWQADEIIGKHVHILFPEDRLEEYKFLEKIYKEGKEEFMIRSQRKTKEGKLRWVENVYSLLPDEHGNKTRVSVIVKDITEEKMMQESLARSEEKFRLFIENTDEWIYEMDLKGIFTYSNPAVEKILLYSPNEIINHTIYFFIDEKNKPLFQRELENAIRTKNGWSHQLFVWKDKNGKNKILECTSFPILDEQNQLIGFRGSNQDVTEREQIEKNKNEFISMVSHEIKTPLTSIHGALGLLNTQDNLPNHVKELIQLGYRNSKLLTNLIQDIIDIEKIDLGKFEYTLQKVRLSKIIEQSIPSVLLMAGDKKIHIITESLIPDIVVNVDEGRLMQVLYNLISNAIKYSPPDGLIYISMQKIGDRIRVSVRDEGPGVPKEFQSKIFGRFEHAGSILSKEQKGTGLGLNISKTIMEQMNGSIGFTSEPGKGATFYIELPIIQEVIK